MSQLDFKVKMITEDKAEVRWIKGDGRKGTTNQWAKVVEGFEIGEKIGGNCVSGKWLSSGQMVNLPCFIVIVNAEGSWRHPSCKFYAIKVNKDGTHEILYRDYYDTQGERARAILEAKRLFEQFKAEVGEKPKEIKISITVPTDAPPLPEWINRQTLEGIALALGIDQNDLEKILAAYIASRKS